MGALVPLPAPTGIVRPLLCELCYLTLVVWLSQKTLFGFMYFDVQLGQVEFWG